MTLRIYQDLPGSTHRSLTYLMNLYGLQWFTRGNSLEILEVQSTNVASLPSDLPCMQVDLREQHHSWGDRKVICHHAEVAKLEVTIKNDGNLWHFFTSRIPSGNNEPFANWKITMFNTQTIIHHQKLGHVPYSVRPHQECPESFVPTGLASGLRVFGSESHFQHPKSLRHWQSGSPTKYLKNTFPQNEKIHY